jgi:hypothetical protein
MFRDDISTWEKKTFWGIKYGDIRDIMLDDGLLAMALNKTTVTQPI